MRRSVRGLFRVPVMSGYRCIELAGPERVRRLAKFANVELIRRRKDKCVVEIQVHPCGDDSQRPARRGNPCKYSHCAETRDNVANVWMLKHLPDGSRSIFQAVVEDCCRRAA